MLNLLPDGNFQGLTLQAPERVFVTELTQQSDTWRRDQSPHDRTYSGELPIEGVFSVFVQAGMQEEIWHDLSRKIGFVVTNLSTGEKMERVRVDGGWHLARQGISVVIAQPPGPDPDYYASLPSGAIYAKNYRMDVFDNLPQMPEPGAVLEIYVKYRGFQSDPVRVNVVLSDQDGSRPGHPDPLPTP
ncbi:hypothetical protein ACXYTJ_00365 [Gilvimarinus sp. F26214L]|uniref:hypothetical protein n=1 Tax=Gilvimarinus sp. DZF01 TaxID=3461371 RepID=UPI0040465DEA